MTQVVLVMDESGSMADAGKKPEVISAFNSYIDQLRAQNLECQFTLMLFNSGRIEKRCDRLPLDRVPHLTDASYTPQGMTPLYDALGKAITELGEENEALFIILTDGLENTSTRFTKAQIKALIGTKESAGVRFIYLGCDIDAMAESGAIGIFAGQTVRGTAMDTYSTFASYASNLTGRYTTGVRDYNNEQVVWNNLVAETDKKK